ncbi:MAG: DUF4433 domain-containing protein [Polyangiaceae bacterium]|nr:DUF4433 domain-containing protein [Polyangiaceae bacterium]
MTTWSKRLGSRDFWPKFVYHFTDLPNALSILESDKLCSRVEAQAQKLLKTDSACPAVIEGTDPDHTRYARLYFRPRTPTQYRNEGIRTRSQIWENAHCPMPVFFCFDTVEVLTMDGTELSNGNMGSPRVEHGAAIDMLSKIPFEYVFHDGGYSPEMRDLITFHRHAEILIPHSLTLLPSLKWIVCRSPAEQNTLLHLLPDAVRKKWQSKVRIDYRTLFERKWFYVNTVTTVGSDIEFRFNPDLKVDSSLIESFEAKLIYAESNGVRRTWKGQMQANKSHQRFAVEDARRGVVTLTLDGHIAFAGPVNFEDTPF